MSSKRAYIPWPEKCAALICLAFGIPYDHAKAMDVDAVLSLVDFDHYPIPKAHGGPDKFFNLTPRLRPGHRIKTAKIDIPVIAKTKRVRAANAAHTRIMLNKTFGDAKVFEELFQEFMVGRPKAKRKMPSRPFPKGQRKMQSRNTLRRAK